MEKTMDNMMRIVNDPNELLPEKPKAGERIFCDLFGNGHFHELVITTMTKSTFTAARGCLKVHVCFKKMPKRHSFWRSPATKFANYQYLNGENE